MYRNYYNLYFIFCNDEILEWLRFVNYTFYDVQNYWFDDALKFYVLIFNIYWLEIIKILVHY